MSKKIIGIIVLIFFFILTLVLIFNRNNVHFSFNNNNKITSLSYKTIKYNKDMTIIQDPSCAIVEITPTNDNAAEKYGLYKTRDYYILSSYNSCNTSANIENNNISLDALKYVISQGVRFLDFEIYSLDNKPIVSTSNSPNNYHIFKSNNYVNFSDAFEVIINNAFNISTCPNNNDPLFVHLRVKSKNDKMLKNLASIFEKYENSTNYILGTNYSFEKLTCSQSADKTGKKCVSNNITEEPLYYFQNKIILILDRSNTTALDCNELMEFINLTSNSLYCRLINNFTMINSHDQRELLEFNKRTVTIVTPDIGINKNNPDIDNSKLLGIQFNANNFYKKDNSLTHSINMFNTAGCAFILKPPEMRYYPITVTLPSENPSSYALKPTEVKTRFIEFSI